MIKFVIDDEADLSERLTALEKRIGMQWDWSVPMEIICKPFESLRTRGQNSLYWRWLGRLAIELSTRQNVYSKDDFHDLLRHRFLGTEEVNIAGEVITRLPSTTRLGKAGMSSYMAQIEAWATDCGIFLPIPADNEYKKYREATT